MLAQDVKNVPISIVAAMIFMKAVYSIFLCDLSFSNCDGCSKPSTLKNLDFLREGDWLVEI